MPIDHLPVRWRSPAHRLRDILLTEVPLMVIIGTGLIGRGVSYLPGGIVSHPAEGALPITVWAWVWITVGVACLVTIRWRGETPAAVAVGLGIGLNAVWAASFLSASLTGDMPRGWVTSIGYGSVATLALWTLWRTPRATAETITRGEVADELRRGDQ